jgi:hypothetical protein
MNGRPLSRRRRGDAAQAEFAAMPPLQLSPAGQAGGVDRSDGNGVGATARSPVGRPHHFGVTCVGMRGSETGDLPVAPTTRGLGAAVAGHGVGRSDWRLARAWRMSAPSLRLLRAAADLRSMISAVRWPWTRLAVRQRTRPAAVRAPVLLPPCRRQRPFAMAGWRQAQPARVRAPQRGAARKSPEGLPWRRRPRLRAEAPSGLSAEGFGPQAGAQARFAGACE